MTEQETDRTRIVVTIKDKKEFLTLVTAQGAVELEIRGTGTGRARVSMLCPRSISVMRSKREQKECAQ
jgi:hypothetical protein